MNVVAINKVKEKRKKKYYYETTYLVPGSESLSDNISVKQHFSNEVTYNNLKLFVVKVYNFQQVSGSSNRVKFH